MRKGRGGNDKYYNKETNNRKTYEGRQYHETQEDYNPNNYNNHNNYNKGKSKKGDIFSQALNTKQENNSRDQNEYQQSEQSGFSNNSNYDQPNFYRHKGDPFAKNTHKNQNYKKREYNRKNFYNNDPNINQSQETNPNINMHNIDPNYNPEFKRIQGKILDIELRQEDESNIEQIQELRDLVKNNINSNYKEITKNLETSINKKSEFSSQKEMNILQTILSKNKLVLNNSDLVTNIIECLSTNKDDNQIAQELLDLLGLDEMDTISELIQNRAEIKELVSIAKTLLDDHEKSEKQKENSQMYGKTNPNSNITIEVMDSNKSKKKKISEIQKTHLTNLKILESLGFDRRFLAENEALGLHEKKFVAVGNSGPINIDAFSNISRRITNNKKTEFLTESNRHRNHVEIVVKPLLGQREPVNRVKVEEMPLFAQKCFNFAEFNEIQSTVYNKAFKSDENLLICAPTGAGKTNIALLTILREIQKSLNNLSISTQNISDFSNITWPFKIVYLVPLKALANEIVDKFKTTLSFLNIKVNEFSADVNLSKEQIENTNLFVAIPEKWDLFTRKNDAIFTSLKLMIIDEVHLLNEDRGRVLECIVARTIRKMELNQKFIRIAGLSATLPNYWDVAEFLRVKDGLFHFDSSYRATPLKMKFLGVLERTSDEEYRSFENAIVFDEIVKYIDKGKQVLVFVHSRMETMNFARDIIKRAQMNGRSDILSPGASLKFSKNYKFTNKTLDELTPYGIGFHNAGLMRKDRNNVETLFANKFLNVLVSTSTLAWGVNLPAYAVIIKGVTFYDAANGCLTDMGILDIQQMFGRAGRPQFDNKGVAMIVTPFKKVDFFVNLLKNQIEIESKLPKFLCDALNAEIAIGNILNLDDAVSWLNLTYMGIRMRGNNQSTDVNSLRNMADSAFETLNKFKLIRYVKANDTVHSTELGRIACKYYMSYRSIAGFYENLKEDMYDGDLMNLYAKSEEFTSMKVYPEEKKELTQLAENLGLLNKNKVDATDVSNIPKPVVLLQTYLKGYYEFKASSLHMDCAYISDNSTRIMRAILEIALHKHLVRTTLLCLNWVKMVERKVAPGTTPLWQFTYESNRGKGSQASRHLDYNSEGFISPDICKKVDGISDSLDSLLHEDKAIIANLLKLSPYKVDSLLEYIRILPKFKMNVSVQPITRTILNVTINLTPVFKWKKKWNHLSEPFWIIVDDKREIIHYESYTLQARNSQGEQREKKDHDERQITFAIPFRIEAGEKEARPGEIYTISLISDRWLGVEMTHHILLDEIEVPNDHDVHTELLDLYPLPKNALNQPEFEKIFSFSHFNPVQTQVFYSCYNSDENILVGAPTGSGKTVIAELAILRVFRLKPTSKIIYIAPLKSLAKERIRDWDTKLNLLNKKVIELTGDFTPDVNSLLEADLLITTPEKWDGISRNWHHRVYVQKVALVIIDEIHLLGLERGPVLEVIVSRMRYIAEKQKSDIRFVGLSTALANAFDVATWLGINTNLTNSKRSPGLFNFKPAVRPCPVTVHIEGFAEKHYCPRMGTMNKPAYNAIREFSPQKPVLIFVSSRRQTRLTALDLISLCAGDPRTSGSFLKISLDEIHDIVELVKDENLKHTLTFGIGMHHAGLVESDRRIVEDLFYNSSIGVLIATSTLAWGVNFPAHLVVIKGTEYFEPSKKTYVDMPITDVLQMIGRAGRPQYDDSAVACLFVSAEKKNFYKKFLYEPFPLESTLHKVLPDHINAEIASGTLLSKSACVVYITYTYFFRRLLKNPTFYGLKSVNADILNDFLQDLVDSVLNSLAESKCITIHSDMSVSSTFLGYLSSFYYISYKTAYTFEMTLKPNLPIDCLMEILCDAQEFSGLPVRHNEEDINLALSKLCRFNVDISRLDSPHIKTNLLLQAHMSRIELPISDYVTDSKLVLDNCIRIILFMIDIAAEKRLLDTTINLITLTSCIMQGLWLDDSTLLSLPHLNQEMVSKLNKINISHLPELIEKLKGNFDNLKSIFADCGILSNKLSHHQIEEISKVLKKIPDVSIDYKLFKLDDTTMEKKRDSPLEGEVCISVALEKKNFQYDNYLAHSQYTKLKSCRWFLVLGNKYTNELLGMKKISFKHKKRVEINFSVEKFNSNNQLDDDSVCLYLMSDSYVGIDQEYPVVLKSVNEDIIRKLELKGGYVEENREQEWEEIQEEIENKKEELTFDNW